MKINFGLFKIKSLKYQKLEEKFFLLLILSMIEVLLEIKQNNKNLYINKTIGVKSYKKRFNQC